MPTQLPRPMPTLWQGAQLAALLVLFRWYGYRRQRALKRLLRTETDRDGVRWERAVRRWLDCSARIAGLLGEPEPPEVTKLRKALDEPDDGETDTPR